MITEWGNMHMGVCTVALYDTLGVDAFKYIVNQTELITVVCSGDFVEKITKNKVEDSTGRLQRLQYLVSFDPVKDDVLKAAEGAGLRVYTFAEVLEQGQQNQLQLIEPDSMDTFMLSYTSGTTGDPKGVKLTHRMITMMNYNNNVRTGAEAGGLLTHEDVYLSYLPLAHSMEQGILGACAIWGL